MGVPEDVTAIVNEAARALGTIDILVNCAGIPQHDAAENTPLETWDRVLDINLRGTFLCCQAAARIMLPKGSGVIINFSSIAGSVGVGRGANAYCASKGGVETLTKQLALEWAERGIRVNAIAPCQFMTPGLKDVMADPPVRPEEADADMDFQHSPGTGWGAGGNCRTGLVPCLRGFVYGDRRCPSRGRRLPGSMTAVERMDTHDVGLVITEFGRGSA